MSEIPSSRKIRTPGELTTVIREIKNAVTQGVLTQVHPDPSLCATRSRVEEIGDKGPWYDYLKLRFRSADGTKYLLSVETYHGSGGRWGREE